MNVYRFALDYVVHTTFAWQAFIEPVIQRTVAESVLQHPKLAKVINLNVDLLVLACNHAYTAY